MVSRKHPEISRVSWAQLPIALAIASSPLLEFEVLIDASKCEELTSKI